MQTLRDRSRFARTEFVYMYPSLTILSTWRALAPRYSTGRIPQVFRRELVWTPTSCIFVERTEPNLEEVVLAQFLYRKLVAFF